MNRALVVGVYRYKNNEYDRLKGPWSDVSAVRKALGQPRSVYAPGRGEIDTLWNPTEDELRSAITDLFDGARPNTQVLLYFSGQTEVSTPSGGIALTGRDSTAGGHDRDGLTTNDLRALAKASDASSVQVIVDGSRRSGFELDGDDLVETTGRLGTNKSFAVLAAANGHSVSDASRLGELSVFTRTVIDELEGEREEAPGADIDITELADRLGPDHNASGLVSSHLHVEGEPGPILRPTAIARATGFTAEERSRGALASTLIAVGVLALAFVLPRLIGGGSTSVETNSELADATTEVAGQTVARTPTTTVAPSTTANPPTVPAAGTPTSAPTAMSTIAPGNISNSTETSSGASSSPLTTPTTARATTSSTSAVTTTEARRVPVRPDVSTTTAAPRTTTTAAPTTTATPPTTAAPATTAAPTTTSAKPVVADPVMPSDMTVQGSFNPDPTLSQARFTFEGRTVTSVGSNIRGIRFTDTNDGEAFYRVRVRDYRIDSGLGSCPNVDGFQVLTCFTDGSSGSRAARLTGTVEADIAGIGGSGQTHTRAIPDLRGGGANDVLGGSGTMQCVDMRSILEQGDGLEYSNWTKPQCFLGGPFS